MPTFIALLRGVNVGKAKRVPRAELRALLTGLGYTHVATLLNSGNAVFRAARGPPEQLAVGKHAAYLLCANGILESKAGGALLGKAGKLGITTRNWATVLKLQALAVECGA